MEALTGSHDSSVKHWNLESGAVIRSILAHNGLVWCVTADWISNRAVSGSSDRTVKLWMLEDGSCLQTCNVRSKVRAVAVNWCSMQAVCGSQDGGLAIWSLDTANCIAALPNMSGAFEGAIAVDWTSELALSGSAEGGLQLWNLRMFASIDRDFRGHKAAVTDVAANWLSERCMSSSRDGTVRLWDLKSGWCLQTFQAKSSSSVQIFTVTVHWAQALLVCGDYDGQISVWQNFETGLPPELLRSSQASKITSLMLDDSGA